MTKRGRPTQKEALARAWQTIRTAGADGADVFDIKAALIGLATDPENSTASRLNALKLLREIEIAEINRAALAAAGLT